MIELIEAEVNRDLEQLQESAEVRDISPEQNELTENERNDVAAEENAALDESEADDLNEDEEFDMIM